MMYAADTGIVSKPAEGLARMITAFVAVFEAADLIVSETKTKTLLLQNQALRTSPLAIEATGQMYRQTMQVWYRGGFVATRADHMPEIKPRIRLARACYGWFNRELFDMEGAPFTLKVRNLNTGAMVILLHGCVTCTLGQAHAAERRMAHPKLVLRIVVFQRRRRTDHPMSYAKPL